MEVFPRIPLSVTDPCCPRHTICNHCVEFYSSKVSHKQTTDNHLGILAELCVLKTLTLVHIFCASFIYFLFPCFCSYIGAPVHKNRSNSNGFDLSPGIRASEKKNILKSERPRPPQLPSYQAITTGPVRSHQLAPRRATACDSRGPLATHICPWQRAEASAEELSPRWQHLSLRGAEPPPR